MPRSRLIKFLMPLMLGLCSFALICPGALADETAFSEPLPVASWREGWFFPGSPTPPPSPSPTPTPSPFTIRTRWIPRKDFFGVYGPGVERVTVGSSLVEDPSKWKEITVTEPGRAEVVYYDYPQEEYSPHKKTIAYSLMEEAYKAVFEELFGISLTTPTPPPSPTPVTTPTPVGYKTPAATPTPEYCASPLTISKVDDLQLSQVRSTYAMGWGWGITLASAPSSYSNLYAFIYDNENFYNYNTSHSGQDAALVIKKLNDNVYIQEGDYLTVTFDSQTIKVYPPALSGISAKLLYIASDGSTYYDRQLCQPAKLVPTPLPTPSPSSNPTPSATPTPVSYRTPTPPPTPPSVAYQTPPPTLTPSPGPSRTPTPTPPLPFALIDTLNEGAIGGQMWSVYADESYVYGGSEDGNIYIWNRSDLSFKTSLNESGVSMYSVFSTETDSGKYLYGANSDGKIYCWAYDPVGGNFFSLTELNPGAGIMYSVFADEAKIYGGNYDGNLYVWRLDDFALQTVLGDGAGPLYSVCADDGNVYGADNDHSIYVWDKSDFSLSSSLTQGADLMWSVTADSGLLYGGNSDRYVYVWAKPAFGLETAVTGAGDWVGSVSSDNRKYFYGASRDSNIYTWHIADYSYKNTLSGGGGSANAVFADRYDPGDGITHYIFGANGDGRIYVWLAEATPTPVGYKTPVAAPRTWGDRTPTPPPVLPDTPVPSPEILPTASAAPTPIGSPTPEPFSLLGELSGAKGWMYGVFADSDYIYGANEDGNLYVWGRDDHRLLARLTFPDCGAMLSVCADGDYIYGANDDSRVYVWDRRTFDLAQVLTDGKYYAESVFSDGEYVYSANYDRNVYIWKRSDFSLQTVLTDAAGWLTSVYADQNRIYAGSGGLEYNVYLWDRSTFKLQKILTAATNDLNSVRADGDYIYGASADGNVYIWDYSRFYLTDILADSPRQATSVISEDGYLYSSSLDDNIYIWEGTSFALDRKLEDSDQPILSMYVSGDLILGSSRDGNIYIWQGPDLSFRYIVDDDIAPPLPGQGGWLPVSTPPAGGRRLSGAAGASPTPFAYEWVEPAEPYHPHKETIAYPLLQETYKKVYEELFGIRLTTPTPPPTAIPTATPFATLTPQSYKTPTSSSGDVVINEINWGGTVSSEDDQWIELYNNGSGSVDLNGWTIEDNTAGLWTITIENLSSSLSAGGYFVLVRGSDPTGGKGDYIYGDSKVISRTGTTLVLNDSTGATQDTANGNSNWGGLGGTGLSVERISPAGSGTVSTSNWNTAPATSTYEGGNRGTPGAKNSSQVSSSASRSKAVGASRVPEAASEAAADLTLYDYAEWIDFETGNYFKLYEWDLSTRDQKYALFDYLPNTAFIYLVTGYQPCAEYFREKLLELVRDNSFDWGGKDSCRYIADLAEAALAMAKEGLFSKEERKEIKEKLYELAIRNRGSKDHGNYAHGVICGLNAVVGYIIGGERGDEMIAWANNLLSYDDTWSLPENSRHYQGLFIREMLRVALYSNRMGIPEEDDWGIAWKDNFARQINWILDTFPHNGFNPAYGREYRQNYIDHFIAPLAVATSVLDDGNPDHIRLAREAKWLLQKMFLYGKGHKVSDYGQNDYGYEASQWGPFAILLNPVYLYWYLNEGLTPLEPSTAQHGSKVIYRPAAPDESIASVYDRYMDGLVTRPDKIVHRNSWGGDALFLLQDLTSLPEKTGEEETDFAGNILSISSGGEEFLTGLTMGFLHGSDSLINATDALSESPEAELIEWEDGEDYSRSITVVRDRDSSWTRKITLYKKEDERLEVKDTLPKKGSVYWHLQGEPEWGSNGVVLEVNGTLLEVEWEGAERAAWRNWNTWADPDPLGRWCYSGNPDREIKLYRSSPGTITTTFRPVVEEE